MSYPGDSSLSPDVQNRILTTFEQTLALAEQGNRQEALLGCDFVLRMDPRFQPARQLVERLERGNGAARVDDLRASVAAPAVTSIGAAGAIGPIAGEDSFDFADLGDELPDLLADPAPDGGLRSRLEELFVDRRYEELLAAAQAEGPALAADPQLAGLAQTAQERLEAAPYVAKFLAKAQEALARGDRAEVGRMLEKARALDPTHPGLAAIEIEQAGAAPRPATPRPAAPITELPAALRPSMLPVDDLTAGASGDAESDRRIAQLLAEGQAAFQGGDPQAAIDSWSRIFLIDIDHQEAARRIEMARKLKAENERQVEEVFHDGVASLEAGDLTGAQRAFERVLELQPSYLAAREYLDQIAAGTVPAPRPRPAGPAAAAPSVSEPAAALGDELPDLGDMGELKEEILVPPEPGEVPATRAEKRVGAVATVQEGRLNRTFLYVGGGVLALVLLAGGFFYLNKDRFFPNSGTDELTAPAPAPGPIDRAEALKRSGKAAMAIAQLQRLPPGDPNYERAQALIAEWERPASPAAAAAPPPLAPEVETRRQQMLAAARQAFTGSDYLLAVQRYEQAATLARLEAPDADQLSRAKTRLEPLAQQIELFKEHEWEYAIPALWRLREANPGNRDIDRLLIDSYYNLGVRDLQRFDPESAAKQFEEALKLSPDDEALRRQHVFAQTYRDRPQDLLYRIYAKYLVFR